MIQATADRWPSPPRDLELLVRADDVASVAERLAHELVEITQRGEVLHSVGAADVEGFLSGRDGAEAWTDTFAYAMLGEEAEERLGGRRA